MKCNNCGALINEGDTVCSNCGANLDENQENQVIQITENMAPPELDINQEKMGEGVGDLGNTANVSSYSPEQENITSLQKQANNSNNDRVDFSIPTVSKPVDNESVPTDGSVPNVDVKPTVFGENKVKTDVTSLKIGGLTFKVNMGKKIGLPIVIIVVILTFIIGIILGKLLFSKNYCVATRKSNVSNTKVKYVSDGKNNVTNVGSYTYKIPDNYIYDKSNKGLIVMDENDTFKIFIRASIGNFDDMRGAKTSIRETLKENGTNVSNIKELNINDIDYLIVEATYKNNNRLIVFSDASNGYVFYTEIADNSNNFNYDVLDIASDIMKNAVYEEKTSNMEKLEINDIYDLTLKAANEYKRLINN